MGQLHTDTTTLAYTMKPATAILFFAGLCLVTADPEPEANPGWSSGYGGHSVSHVSSGGFGHGGHHGGSVGYVSRPVVVRRPVVTQRVVKVVKPVVVRRPVVTTHRRVVSSGYRQPVSSGYYGGGHRW